MNNLILNILSVHTIVQGIFSQQNTVLRYFSELFYLDNRW